MGKPVEKLWEDLGVHAVEAAAALAEDVRQRVEGIRNGTGHWPGLEEVLAELDQCRTELMPEPLDGLDDEDADPAALEAAWAMEIKRRVDEIRGGTAKTYAAEDVIAAMRLRFG